MDKVLSIVIPVFNKWNFTKSCLKDLVQLPDDHEIIIIDNASTDETNVEINKFLDEYNKTRIEECLKTGNQFCGITYYRHEENKFHSKACNKGFRIAIGENVLFLNNDIRVRDNHASWTKNLIDACNSTNGLVGPTMGLLNNDLDFVKEANQQLTGNSYLGGWCIAASRDTWYQLAIGDPKQRQIWNEEFPFYFNDTDLSFRARKLGVPLTCISLPDITHFGKISAAQINIPKLYNEGRQVFLKKWSK
jgi:O-antigen biosynthesis protein